MEENRCKFWLPRKNRSCANAPLNGSPFCGNHKPRSDSQWIPCPIDPSHSVLQENLEGHVKRCPLLKQTQSLSLQPYYQKGINAGKEEDNAITSEMKRIAVYSMTVSEFYELIKKIESIHATICDDISESYKIPEACNMWIKREVDSKLPFQEKHVKQQASIIGNLEYFGVINSSLVKEQCDVEGISLDKIDSRPAVVEFGAGRGYLTQMLADCYGIDRVFLVERKSYKLKADRSLRQKESLILERLRIDIEDLNLNAVESLRAVPFLAIGKHLCGPATGEQYAYEMTSPNLEEDSNKLYLTLRCCLSEQDSERSMEQCHGNDSLKGIAIATCCHHLCQWKHYANKKFMVDLGITKEEFHAITWFTSWAVDADHGSDLSVDSSLLLQFLEEEQHGGDVNGIEDVVRNMKAVERAVLGFMCKQIIDMGRMMWARERGLETQLVKYVPSSISPENHLLIAKHAKCS